MKKNSLAKGAIILIVFNVIGKIIGAVYRIPLAKIIGGVGMGEYQLCFPIYCLILTISTSGIPASISKLVAEFNVKHRFYDIKRLLVISIVSLSLISGLGATLIVVGAKFISKIQGNPDAYICFYGITPAILFVGILSVLRGYFQGNLKVFPTAFSCFFEQLFKLVFGLFFAKKMAVYGVEYAVLGALAGVSASEFLACIFLILYFAFSRQKNNIESLPKTGYKSLVWDLYSLSIPMTLGSLIIPITSMIDSLLVVNLLLFSGFEGSVATTFFGLQTGVVEPLVNLPAVIATSVSIVLIPNISTLKTEGKKEEIKMMLEKMFEICLSISVVCFACYIIFGKQIITFLYGNSFDFDDILKSVKILFVSSVNIVFLSLVQIVSSALNGMGETKTPIKALAFGAIAKILVEVVLIPIKSVNIYGAVISCGFCYFVAFVINYSKLKKLVKVKIFGSSFHLSVQICLTCFFAFVSNLICGMVFDEAISLFVSGFVAVAVYLTTFYYFFFYNNDKGKNDINLAEN